MHRGYSLIEILLVIAIFAVIAGLSAPFYGRFLTQNAVANSVDQLVADIHKAQFYAMVSRQTNTLNWGVNIDNTTKKITLYRGNAFSGHDVTFDETFTINDNVTVSPASTDLNFARRTGIPTSGSFPLTITISGQGNSKSVIINSQGMVTK